MKASKTPGQTQPKAPQFAAPRAAKPAPKKVAQKPNNSKVIFFNYSLKIILTWGHIKCHMVIVCSSTVMAFPLLMLFSCILMLNMCFCFLSDVCRFRVP